MAILCLAAASIGGVLLFAADAPTADQRGAAEKQFQAGNYRDAYEVFHKLALDPQNDAKQVGGDLKRGIDCLNNLGRTDEIDAFRDQVVEAHAANWRLLNAAAETFFNGPHYGFIVAGEFSRGNKRGGGRYVGSFERDRVRALQLMEQGRGKIAEETEKAAGQGPRSQAGAWEREVGGFYFDFARFLLGGRDYGEAWRLQTLSDLAELPDYEEGYYGRWGYRVGNQGAPVDTEGNPVYYRVPATFEEAANDGERWRWALAETVKADPSRSGEVKYVFAGFLHSQFGVQTMQQYQALFSRAVAAADDKEMEDQEDGGPYAVHTLGEDETLARLATGVKRFKLPDEFNFIRIYQQIAAGEKGAWGEQSLNQLAQIFENRRQYPKAADYWRKSIERYGPGPNNYKKQRLEQIVGHWGRFENISVQPAGQGASVEFRYRNGHKVSFEAHRIKVDKLLEDVKTYLKSNPAQLEWQKFDLSNLGYRLVYENQAQYIGEKVAGWETELKPPANHFDARITVATPLREAGAYLLTGNVADGNTSRIILWVADTAIVQKQMDNKRYYYVADAVSGKPVSKANVEFFGYQQKFLGNNKYQVLTSNFAEFTDANGQVTPDSKDLLPNYQWVAIARTDAGRLAYLGFDGVWYGRYHDAAYNQHKVFVVTDRPVYRPGQRVKFKFWVRQARYDQKEVSLFAGRKFFIRINNPKGEQAFEQEFEADEFGGFEGEFAVPADATLGQYHVFIDPEKSQPHPENAQVKIGGGGTFRIEEYKKPEFEVTVDAPNEPVMLGEKITATIQAKYYFGAPVTQAKVHYKVTRTSHEERWFPIARWDWLYGSGYWWFGYEYEWYPGWRRWGCLSPRPWWWHVRHEPPEVVLDNEVAIGPDGTVQVEIDTALAKAVHGDLDHRYEITAEVVDQSRRTIVGTGSVLVAREPFKVFAWVDRGHYRVNDVVHAYFKAQTLDRKPVAGKGALTLFKITYDEQGKPAEAAVQNWELNTDAEGEADIQIKASEAGQYRLSYKVTDDKEHTIEGGYIFNVIGAGFDGSEFRFNHLELIIDKQEYQPGETVRLMINTNRPGSTVLLFVRPANGVYLPPEILHLEGKSTVREIAVVPKDMPNFFIEAVTISNGNVYTQAREVVVPPESRIVNVEVEPSAAEYKPGEEAKVNVKLTDIDGKPFAGSLVLTAYDKSVEYISGGSNVPNIREFFWKWRRGHHPYTRSSLEQYFGNLLKQNETGMGNLGVFGHIVTLGMGGGMGAPANGLKEQAKRGEEAEQQFAFGVELKQENRRMAAAPMMAEDKTVDALRKNADRDGVAAGGGAAEELVEPAVRKNFADTAYWAAAVKANEQGLAEVSFPMPESLTSWRIRAWGLGHGTRVGEGDATVVTTKHLLVRMQAPRFFIETDEVVLSAIVHNSLETAKKATVVLELEGETLAAIDQGRTNPSDRCPSPRSPGLAQVVEIEANGEARVDWRVKVISPGEAVVRMKALTDEESDAMEMRIPVYVHGMLKTESFTGSIRPDKQSASIRVTVPAERKPEQSRLEIRYSPTLAGALVDALPYLVSYPYKTTDTTLTRFLPTVIVQNILKRMNVDLKEVQEKRTNLNPQEIGDAAERARQWKRFDHNPVFDEAEVERMVKENVKALTEMQLSDGGWGWFWGYGERSDPHTTAFVVHGLQIAVENGVAVVPDVIERGVAWLTKHQAGEIEKLRNAPKEKKPYKLHADNIDAFVFMVLADAGAVDDAMRNFLYRDRTHLSVYAKGMFGLALHKLKDAEKLAMIVRNIDQFLIQDDENETAYLKTPNEAWWWSWYGNDVEANAYYLKLLSRTEPQGEKARRLVKYLLNNRKHATYWSSTRDTAVCVEALAEFLHASGEAEPNMTVEVLVDGRKHKEVNITKLNLFSFDNALVLTGDAVTTGVHTVELRKKGTGPLYFNAYLTNFTLEEHITAAGLEVKVNRKFYKLIRSDKQEQVAGARGEAVGQRVEKYERVEIPNLGSLKSGDLVEIELEIDSKNDYEQLVFEDKKGAGFEPVDLRSGYNSNSLGAYMELRDERVVFFVRHLSRGKHSVSYRLRAETPGRFSALPAVAFGMYAAELRGNSEEMKVVIEDSDVLAVGG